MVTKFVTMTDLIEQLHACMCMCASICEHFYVTYFNLFINTEWHIDSTMQIASV